MSTHLDLYYRLRKQARQMRAAPTKAEAKLWSCLRKKQLAGRKFRRQHVLMPFIVDFYCPSEKLVVEVDGCVHGEIERLKYDVERTKTLKQRHGVAVMRVTNDQVLNFMEYVLFEIQRKIELPDPLDTF